MRARPREHPIDFLNGSEEKRSTVITRYRLAGVSGNLLKHLTQQLNATLVRSSVHGVLPSLGSHLQVLKINDLDEASNSLINDCSIILQQLKYSSTIDTVNRSDTKKNSTSNITRESNQDQKLIGPFRDHQFNRSPPHQLSKSS